MNIPVKYINLNGHEYGVIFEEPDSDNLKTDEEDDTYNFGVCHYKTQLIYIANNLNDHMTKFTLIHEITHALICSIGMHAHRNDFDSEDVCEFVAANAENIIRHADGCMVEYLRGKTENPTSTTTTTNWDGDYVTVKANKFKGPVCIYSDTNKE